MEYRKDFKSALINKTIPNLTLDQKWHRLFAIHGKTAEIKETEIQLNTLLGTQGKLNNRLKELKRLKNQLLDTIVQNMDESDEQKSQKKQEETKRLIDEVNEKIDDCEGDLSMLPSQIRKTNENLMLLSMDYFYEKIRINETEAQEIQEWIDQIRVELKKNIIRKQNRDINNREIYAYLHDIFGHEVIDIFDIKYEEENAEETS